MSSPLENLKERSWDYNERKKQSLLHFNPATTAEMQGEYLIILQDLAATFRPEGWAEEHCIEMMALATWCERRAMSAETAAIDCDIYQQWVNKQEMDRTFRKHPWPDGFTAAEQSAQAFGRIIGVNRFLDFLIRYKMTQARLFEMALKRLEHIRKLRVKVEPEYDDLPPVRVPKSDFFGRNYPIQNEPTAA